MLQLLLMVLLLFSLNLIGKASWYGPKFHGKKMSNGKIFNQNKMTVAHKTLPFGTKLLIKNLQNNLKVVVNVTDRGPYIKNRVLDLSKIAAKKLKMIDRGIALVEYKVIW